MRLLKVIKEPFGSIKRELLEMDLVDLVLRLTLIDLLFRPVGDWMVRPFVLILAALGLISPKVLRSPWTWLVLAFLTGLRVVRDWPMSDNHAYLLCYWCLALFISRLVKDKGRTMALNGKLLIGLVFAFSTLWKVAWSDDYLDGRFFRVSLHSDSRFADASMVFGGLSRSTLERNRRFLRENLHGESTAGVPKLVEPESFVGSAKLLTWWTVVIEAAIGVAFLWPFGGWISRQRHFALLLFCATTYAVATVAGFAWLLIVMGLAQCRVPRKTVRLLYLGTFCLVLFYKQVPWLSWFTN